MLTPQQMRALGKLEFEQVPHSWSPRAIVLRPHLNRIVPISTIPLFTLADLYHFPRPQPDDCFSIDVPTVFRIKGASVLELLVNTEGCNYCRYVATLVN